MNPKQPQAPPKPLLKAANPEFGSRFLWVPELFASWCKDCREETSAFNYKKFQDVVNTHCSADSIKLRRLRMGELCGVSIGKALKEIKVERLDFNANTLRDLGALSILRLCQNNPSIKHISLGTNDCGNETAIGFARELRESNRIVTLDLGNEEKRDSLRGNRFYSVAGVAFAQVLLENTSLVSLCLNRVGLGFISDGVSDPKQEAALTLGVTLIQNTTLKTLRIAENHFGSLGTVLVFQGLEKNRSLRTVDLSRNKCGTEIALVAETALANNLHLEDLDLSHNPLGVVGVASLAKGLMVNENILRLDLSSVNMQDKGAIQLASALQTNGSIQNLNISDNNLTVECAPHWEVCLAKNKSLKIICFSKNSLGDVAVQHIASGIARNFHVTSVDLTRVKALDESIVALAMIATNHPSLTSLTLRDNFVTEDGGLEIATILQEGSSIFHIELGANQISHTTLLRLEKICAKHKDDAKSREPRSLMVEIKRLREAEKKLRETDFQLSRTRAARIEIDRTRQSEVELLQGMQQRSKLEQGKLKNDLARATENKQELMAALAQKNLEVKNFGTFAVGVCDGIEANIDAENKKREKLKIEIGLTEEKMENDTLDNNDEKKIMAENISRLEEVIAREKRKLKDLLAELKELQLREDDREAVRKAEEMEAARLIAEAEEQKAKKKGKKGAKGKKGSKGKKGKKKK